jgi:putative ABC transport system permease protein
VLTGGFTRSTEVAVNDNVTADFVVTSIDGQSPMGNKVTPAIARVKGVTSSVAIQIDYAKVGRSTAAISGIDPKEIGSVWRLKWKQGSDASLNRLHGRNALLIESFAKKKKLKVGDDFTVVPPSGKKLRLHVVAIDKQPMYLAALGDITISTQTFNRAVSITPQTTIATLVRTTGGASDASRATLERALKNYPTVKVMTKKQYINLVNKGFVQIQTMFWILLALSLLISVFGIINTLVLAVFERTRELGMLRAVGLTKRQTRGMIRHESITISLIGAALGMPLGVLLAGLVIAALSKYGVVFSLPWALLIIFVIVTVVFGMLAAILPARRAAKLNVLEALQYE